mgnify:FL=1
MSEIIELAPGVHWIGARHPELRMFDELLPTQFGTTYNSYLVQGRDKVALIDTVKAPFTEEFLAKVQALVPLEQIDLVVVNHTEPDHTGALERLLQLNPKILVYCTRSGENFLKQLIETPYQTHVVAEGEELDLGGKTLRFLMAPNLHWPDTMFTHLPEAKILFSCDAFGAHFCPEEGLYDDEVRDFSYDYRHYFDGIMRPFKDKIREAVAKVENLPLTLICPSHGPILRRDPQAAIAGYKAMAAAPPASAKPRALLLTLSPHGSTRTMGKAVREGLEKAGLDVTERAVVGLEPTALRDEFERADLLLIGTPTINRDAPPPVWGALALLSTIHPKGKTAAVFGSYGWSGEAVKLVESRLTGLKYSLAAPGLCFRFKPTAADIEACRQFGQTVAASLSGTGS